MEGTIRARKSREYYGYDLGYVEDIKQGGGKGSNSKAPCVLGNFLSQVIYLL